MNWLDFAIIAVLIVSALFGMRYGLIKAAIMAVGIFIGWLFAGQFADKVGEPFADSLQNDTLVTVLSYAIIMVAAIIVASITAKIIKPLLTVFTLGLSGLVDKLGGLALGVVMGIAISGALIVGLARFTYNFDPETLVASIPGQITDQLAKLDAVKEALENSDLGAELQDQLAKVDDVKTSLGAALTESQVAEQLAKVGEIKDLVGDTQEGSELTQQLSDLTEVASAFEDARGTMSAKVEETKDALETPLTESQLVSVFVDVSDALPGDALGFVPADFRVALDILKDKIE